MDVRERKKEDGKRKKEKAGRFSLLFLFPFFLFP
jgi:hypothetical protein